jgi:hypothetical protein
MPYNRFNNFVKGLNTKAKLLSYYNRGDTSGGDYSGLVGYASVFFKKIKQIFEKCICMFNC